MKQLAVASQVMEPAIFGVAAHEATQRRSLSSLRRQGGSIVDAGGIDTAEDGRRFSDVLLRKPLVVHFQVAVLFGSEREALHISLSISLPMSSVHMENRKCIRREVH